MEKLSPKKVRRGKPLHVCFLVSLTAPFSSRFLPCLLPCRAYRLANGRLLAGFAQRPRRTIVRSPRAVPWEIALPWAVVMVIPRTAAVPVRDDRGRGFACAKAVAARTSRGVGTSVTAKTANAGGWSVAGRRRGGRPDAARTTPPKPSTLRHSVCAVSASAVRRKHRRPPQLRLRVVTQQKLFCRLPCATGRGAMNHP